MTLSDLNAADRERFITEIGWTFEHSPWVAARAWTRRPFASIDALCEAMVAEVESAGVDEQLELLRAHPDLGTRARMSASSTGEQTGAGLDRLTADQFDRLGRLNATYRDTFGFPFLFAVKGSSVDAILDALEHRLLARPEDERAEALGQVARIARFRLESAVSSR